MTQATRVPVKRTLSAILTAIATIGNDGSVIVGKAPFDGVISGVTYVPNTTITGANTNTRRHAIVNKGAAGSGTAEAAALQYNSGVNAAAFDEKALTITSTAADKAVVAGDVIVMTSTHVGNGIADPGGLVNIEFTRS